MRKMKLIVSFLLVMVMVFTMVACGKKDSDKPAGSDQAAGTEAGKAEGSGDKVALSLSHTSSAESPWEKASLKMAEVFNSDPRAAKYEIKTYPNGTLVQKNWKVMFEMIQSDSISMGIESITALASEVPELGSVQLPFLFANDEHIIKFFDSDSPLLQKWYDKFAEKNMVVIAVAPRKFRQLINNKKLVKTPEDIKGMKFRVPDNPFFVRVFELLGAKPTPLPSGEIYSAIQLGTVSGEDNSIPVVFDFKTHEVAKYMTAWNYMGDASLVVMNKKAYDALSAEEVAALKDAAKKWIEVNIAEDETYQKYAREQMEAAGVEFYDMSEDEKAPFKELVKPLYEETKEKIGAEDYDALMELVEKTRP